MKITIKNTDETYKKVSVEIPDDSDIYDVAQSIFELLVAYGFAYKSVVNGVAQLNETYESMEEK